MLVYRVYGLHHFCDCPTLWVWTLLNFGKATSCSSSPEWLAPLHSAIRIMKYTLFLARGMMKKIWSFFLANDYISLYDPWTEQSPFSEISSAIFETSDFEEMIAQLGWLSGRIFHTGLRLSWYGNKTGEFNTRYVKGQKSRYILSASKLSMLMTNSLSLSSCVHSWLSCRSVDTEPVIMLQSHNPHRHGNDFISFHFRWVH